MKVAVKLAMITFLLGTIASAAEHLSGYLVDSKCYKSASGNVAPRSTATSDRDMDRLVKLCAPTSKTTTFGLVQADWGMLVLDSPGNSRAAKVMREACHDVLDVLNKRELPLLELA